MAKVRKDNKGRNLRPGETQRADGSYMYVYKLGTKKKYLYDSDLASLRVKEKQINKDKDDGIRTQEAMKLTLNDMFKVYMNNNIKLKPSTRANYLYLWDFYVKEEPFANMPLPQIHRSDILAFYTKLLKHGFAINSLESINTIVHPTLEMAVDDDYIRKNPSKGIYRKLKTDGSAPKLNGGLHSPNATAELPAFYCQVPYIQPLAPHHDCTPWNRNACSRMYRHYQKRY